MLLVLGGLSGKTDSDAPIGCPSRKSSQAINILLDQIEKTEISEQNDDPTNFIESESESDSKGSSTSSSEEELGTVAPIQRPVAKKKAAAKVVGAGNTSEDRNASGDGMYLMS